MKNHGFMVMAILASLLVCSVASAADTGGKAIPNLVGTWIGDSKAMTLKGVRKITSEFRITRQDGAFFRGVRSWGHGEKEAAILHAGGKLTVKAAEPTLGVIGSDNKTIYLVEHDDVGILRCRLLDPDTFEFVYLESGPHAVIGRGVYKRKK